MIEPVKAEIKIKHQITATLENQQSTMTEEEITMKSVTETLTDGIVKNHSPSEGKKDEERGLRDNNIIAMDEVSLVKAEIEINPQTSATLEIERRSRKDDEIWMKSLTETLIDEILKNHFPSEGK